PTTNCYPLSLHDALPISLDITANFDFFGGSASYPNATVTADGTTYGSAVPNAGAISWLVTNIGPTATTPEQQDALQAAIWRTESSEEHKPELQSQSYLQP